jgi:hypothetical protein
MSRRMVAAVVLALAPIIMLTLCTPQMRVKAAEAPPEPSLESILNSLGFTNIVEITDETFPAGTYKVTMFAEYTVNRDVNTLNWYDATPEDPTLNLIFSGPEGVPPGQPMGMVSPPLTKTVTTPVQFGLALVAPTGTWYTETWRNTDETKHAKVYKDLDDPGIVFIGFEDTTGEGADMDYNDMVISLSTGGVPTPTGTNVTVSPAAGVYFTFEDVTGAGSTTATPSTPPPPPPGMTLIGLYYEISITADYTGDINIVMSYTPIGTSISTRCHRPQPGSIRLLRYDPLPTDVDKDGRVDWKDVRRVLKAMDSCVGSRRYDPACDINHDGVVNYKDLLLVMKDLGKSAWTDITTFVDTTNHLVYGETGHFSGIGVHEQD